jgi:hypothetical protein
MIAPEDTTCRDCREKISKGDTVIGYKNFIDGKWVKDYRCDDCEWRLTNDDRD